MLRCFAAVEVPAPSVRRALEGAQQGLQRAFGPRSPVKWVPVHQFHFTLKFFGEIPVPRTDDAASVLRQVAAGFAPFTLEAVGLGAFPSPARPSVLWAGLGQGRAELVDLAAQVEAGMTVAGFPREPRPFKPHLTLGRIREGTVASPAVTQALQAQVSYGSWRVERLVLMKSELLPAGPKYTIMGAAPLILQQK